MLLIVKRWLDLLLLTITALVICALIHPSITILSRHINNLVILWPAMIQYLIASLLAGGLWLVIIHLGGFSLRHLTFSNFFRYPPVWIFGLFGASFYVWLENRVIAFNIKESIGLNFYIYSGSMLVGVVVVYIVSGRYKLKNIEELTACRGLRKESPETLANLKYLLLWILDESPIYYPEQDLFGLSIMANRITRVLMDDHLKTVGVVGPYGSGKSSLLNMVEYYINNKVINNPKQAIASDLTSRHFNGRLLISRVDGWGRNKGSIAQQILSIAVYRLSLEVDCLSIITLPANYREALSGTKSAIGSILAALLNTDDNPFAMLKRLNNILKTANIRLIIFLEDMDRNAIDEQIKDEMPALLDRLRDFENISFVLAIGTEHSYSSILIRICEHVESLT